MVFEAMFGKSRVFVVLVCFVFLLSFASAAPVIQIHSPQNLSYDSTKILVNVSSNEPVDFFVRDEKTGRDFVVKNNTTTFESYIYARNGGYRYVIWANNSNGVTNATVVFGTTAHNPIEISECGTLYSSDTKYIIAQDISGNDRQCLELRRLRNITLDFNGHVVVGTSYSSMVVYYSSDVYLFNGTLGDSNSYIGIDFEGTKLRFSDLNINARIGLSVWTLDNVVFTNVSVNATVGFWHYSVSNVYFINSSFVWNGVEAGGGPYPIAAFFDQSDHSSIYFENTTFKGFPEYDFALYQSTYTDYYLRHTAVNLSKFKFSDYTADVRLIKQHKVIVNVSDQFQVQGASSVRIMDNGVLPRKEGDEARMSTLANPTAKLYIPIEETGYGETWLTEKLTYARSSSPAEIIEYDFSPYTLTTKGWGSETFLETNLTLTGLNSTVLVNVKVDMPENELSACTISEMLDLNGDEVVNVQDAVIVLRKVAGLPVSINSEKSCKGINLNSF